MIKVLLLITTLVFTQVVEVSSSDPSLDPIQQLKKRVSEVTLENGMKVLILERPVAPLVSFQMMFKTGGVDEDEGKSGLAHLFEHMMFKGSKKVGTRDYEKEKVLIDAIDKVAVKIIEEEKKGKKADKEVIKTLKAEMKSLEAKHQEIVIPAEFDSIYQRAGGVGLNAFTGKDMTGFVISLPSNKWELWPMMEADRMANPVLREFYKERDVVMEERRMRYENSPRGKLWESFVDTAYSKHPYKLPTIGTMKDLRGLTMADAKEFFKTHYAPNNSAVAIVGDVNAREVIQKLASYFANVPAQNLRSKYIVREPPQKKEKRRTVHFDAEPSMLMGYHKPNPPHADNAVMDMIEQILSRGRTSRLYRNIVEKKVAISAWASNGNPGERYPNMIIFGGSPRKPYINIDLENAILAELKRLRSEEVPEEELEKIRNQVESDFIRELSSNKGMASQLSYYQTVLGDWRYLFDYLEGIRNVTPKDIQRVAKKYFKETNKTVTFLQRLK